MQFESKSLSAPMPRETDGVGSPAIGSRKWPVSESTMTKPEEPVQIGTYSYISKPDHRDGTPTKSQWTISFAEECAGFQLGVGRGWVAIDRGAAWGLHMVDGKVGYLGKTAANREPKSDLFVAFFQISDVCHGYPSDSKRSRREVPPTAVFKDWLMGKYLRPSVVRKLQQGQLCSL